MLDALRDESARESNRLLLAVELASDLTVMNDEMATALLSIVENGNQPEEVRARAAISLGPVLEEADTEGFEDNDDLPITEGTLRSIRASLRHCYMDASVPNEGTPASP